jgi:gluconolactonase
VDEEGHIYCTGPGGVWIISPHGELIAHLRLPERAANCAWGDADRRGLYVTACTSLFRIRTHVPGG